MKRENVHVKNRRGPWATSRPLEHAVFYCSYVRPLNKWLFDHNDVIKSVKCQNKFITIQGASSGNARLVTKSETVLIGTQSETSFEEPEEQNEVTNIPTKKYTKAPQEVKSDYPKESEWDSSIKPLVGSPIVLSELVSHGYQKWEKCVRAFIR
eukprot:scaffold26983_cov23-Cyclotella_meneghiniana.AAC.1